MNPVHRNVRVFYVEYTLPNMEFEGRLEHRQTLFEHNSTHTLLFYYYKEELFKFVNAPHCPISADDYRRCAVVYYNWRAVHVQELNSDNGVFNVPPPSVIIPFFHYLTSPFS